MHSTEKKAEKKTTLYLPEDLKVAVKRAAGERKVSEAQIIRESIGVSVGGVRPRARSCAGRGPHLPSSSDHPVLMDEAAQTIGSP